jgi:hypothetical protein
MWRPRCERRGDAQTHLGWQKRDGLVIGRFQLDEDRALRRQLALRFPPGGGAHEASQAARFQPTPDQRAARAAGRDPIQARKCRGLQHFGRYSGKERLFEQRKGARSR